MAPLRYVLGPKEKLVTTLDSTQAKLKLSAAPGVYFLWTVLWPVYYYTWGLQVKMVSLSKRTQIIISWTVFFDFLGHLVHSLIRRCCCFLPLALQLDLFSTFRWQTWRTRRTCRLFWMLRMLFLKLCRAWRSALWWVVGSRTFRYRGVWRLTAVLMVG